MRFARSLPLAILLAAVAAPAATARKRVLGSSLKASATIVERHRVDSAFWPRRIPGRSFRAPAKGQVLEVRVKGSVLRSSDTGAADPLNRVHFQSLRPAGRRRMTVVLTSAPFYVPIGGERDQVTTYRPENLCVVKGGVVAFNDLGGFQPPWYERGAPFRVFGEVAGSSTARYTRNDGTKNGTTYSPTVREGSELLMQVVLGTGRHMSGACRAWRP